LGGGEPGGSWALILPFFDEVRKDPRWQDYRGEFGL